MQAPERLAAASTVAAHGWHFAAAALFLVAGLAAAAFADAREAKTESSQRRPFTVVTPLLLVCAVATVAAAAVHVYVIPEHFEESWMYGTFFVCLATVQLAWAAWVTVRPSLPLLAAGAAANTAVVLLWAASRFIAVPLGPGAGTREAIGRLDVFATSCELVVIVTALLLLRTFARATVDMSPAGPQTLKRNSVTSPSAIT